MANYYMNISHGTVGKGEAHAKYILGQGNYKYKDKEVQYVSNSLPSWAENEVDFWIEGDNNENINGRVYTELKLSLPNDLDLENNIILLDDFLEKTLGENHHYTAVIHDKESSYEKGTQNIHAHIMFSTRKLDGIERDRKAYFKRANRVSKEKGGYKKDRYWKSKDKLLEVRKNWEILQNKYLEDNNIENRVSCETLEKQREEALKDGDSLKAELLDREPINIDGQILMKINKTPREEKELERFKNSREIKTLKEIVYNLELEKLEVTKKIELENEILKAKEEVKTTLSFSNVLKIKSDIEMYNLEIEKNLNNLKKLEPLAIRNLYPKLNRLTLELENIIDNSTTLKEVESLDKNITIETLKIDKNVLAKEIKSIEQSLMNKNKILNLEKLRLENVYETKLDELETVELDTYLKTQTFETNKEIYASYIDKNIEMTKLNEQFKKLKSYSQDPNIEKTALNILTGYKYSKLEKERDFIMTERGKLATKIEATTERNMLKGDGSDKCNSWIKEYDMLFEKYNKKRYDITKMLDKLNTPEMKNKKIRIEKSIDKKLKKQKEDNLFKQFELKTTLDILKEKIYLIQDKKEPILSNIEQLKKEIQTFGKSIQLVEMKLEEKVKLLDNYNYELKAYSLLTTGQITKIIKESNKIVDEVKELRIQKSKIPSYKFLKKKSINLKIETKLSQYNNLDKEYKELQVSIPTEKLYEKILELKKEAIKSNKPDNTKRLKEQLKGLKNKVLEKENKVKFNHDLLRETKNRNYKESFKPKQLTFNEFKKQQLSNGHSNLKLWSREDENDGYEM